jgi:hypothetical protein
MIVTKPPLNESLEIFWLLFKINITMTLTYYCELLNGVNLKSFGPSSKIFANRQRHDNMRNAFDKDQL